MSTRQVSRTEAWLAFWSQVGSEEWLAAKALLEVDVHEVVLTDAAQWITRFPGVDPLDAGSALSKHHELDWEGWVADVDLRGRGWSSTQVRLFEIVACLVVPGRAMRLVGVLDQLASWEPRVWRILVEWGTGGNNRDLAGRLQATASHVKDE